MDFKIRELRTDDLESLVKYANNWNISKNLTNRFPYPYTKVDGEQFIQSVLEKNPIQMFAIAVQGEVCGGIGIFPQADIYCKNAELGYWLAEPFWGKGIITRAVEEMVEYAFKTYNIDRIFARPFGSNKASRRVLEKNGFKLEGRFEKIIWKKDRYEDELVYAIRR